MFLLLGLSLGVLSPPAQLKVDKFPHHEGLREADGAQDSYPSREREREAPHGVLHKDTRAEFQPFQLPALRRAYRTKRTLKFPAAQSKP